LDHQQKMADELAKYNAWKTAADKKHSDVARSLENQLADLRKKHTAKETESAKAYETLRKSFDQAKIEHQNILNKRD
jgi:UDP-N-acetylglucosamine transferase subunit ALG13